MKEEVCSDAENKPDMLAEIKIDQSKPDYLDTGRAHMTLRARGKTKYKFEDDEGYDDEFHCAICNERFSLAGDLSIHNQMTHGIDEPASQICTKTFANEEKLQKHEIAHQCRKKARKKKVKHKKVNVAEAVENIEDPIVSSLFDHHTGYIAHQNIIFNCF